MENVMENIFKPFRLGDVSVRNRIVAQAMEINSSDPGGRVSERILSRYNRLASGKWGIVFIEATSVTGDSLARNNGLVMSRENLGGFSRLFRSSRAMMIRPSSCYSLRMRAALLMILRRRPVCAAVVMTTYLN
jgi:2,4-dienoyl-CoA reductase-like NADH-dependent reductase (Old Yellow Enzyme family)